MVVVGLLLSSLSCSLLLLVGVETNLIKIGLTSVP
jgi:hypothetical protein